MGSWNVHVVGFVTRNLKHAKQLSWRCWGFSPEIICQWCLPCTFRSLLILLSLICSRELSFAVMMKIPLPFGIMIKTLPKFTRHIHPSQADQLCAENTFALFVNETRQRQGRQDETHSSLLARCPPSIALLFLKLTGELHWSSCSYCGRILPQGNHFSLSQASCSLA